MKAHATKILIDGNKRAYGVQFIRDGIRQAALVRKEVNKSFINVLKTNSITIHGTNKINTVSITEG